VRTPFILKDLVQHKPPGQAFQLTKEFDPVQVQLDDLSHSLWPGGGSTISRDLVPHGSITTFPHVDMPSIAMILPERQTTSTPAEPLDMSTNAPSILAINGFFTWFAVLIVLARIYVRAFMLKTFGPDDYLIVAAMVSTSFPPSPRTVFVMNISLVILLKQSSLPKNLQWIR
jgi:hypothetical protein